MIVAVIDKNIESRDSSKHKLGSASDNLPLILTDGRFGPSDGEYLPLAFVIAEYYLQEGYEVI